MIDRTTGMPRAIRFIERLRREHPDLLFSTASDPRMMARVVGILSKWIDKDPARILVAAAVMKETTDAKA